MKSNNVKMQKAKTMLAQSTTQSTTKQNKQNTCQKLTISTKNQLNLVAHITVSQEWSNE